MIMCMTDEHSEKFTLELTNLNSNLAQLNQKFDAALEIASKDVEIRFLKHEQDCPARNKKRNSEAPDADVKRAKAMLAVLGPFLIRYVLPFVLGGGALLGGQHIMQNNTTQPAVVTAPAKTGD